MRSVPGVAAWLLTVRAALLGPSPFTAPGPILRQRWESAALASPSALAGQDRTGTAL